MRSARLNNGFNLDAGHACLAYACAWSLQCMQRDVLANETAVQMRFYESNKSVPLVNNGMLQWQHVDD